MELFKPKQHLSSFYAKLSQQWFSPIPLKFQGNDFNLGLSYGEQFTSGLELVYIWHEEEVCLYLPQEKFCGFLDPGLKGLVLTDVVEDWQSIFFKVAQEIIAEIFSQFGESLTAKSVRWVEEANTNMLSLPICKDQVVFYNIFVSESTGNLHFLSGFFKKHCPENPFDWGQLKFPFIVESGRTYLSFDELKSLRIGDIILVHHEDKKLRFRWENLFFEGDIEGKTVSVKTMIMEEENDLPVGIIPEENDQNKSNEEENLENTESKEKEENEASIVPEISVDQLSINITFDTGQKTFTIEQLKQLHEGYTFELDNKVDDKVKILANGQCIGEGEWVQIDERLGVRVTHLSIKA